MTNTHEIYVRYLWIFWEKFIVGVRPYIIRIATRQIDVLDG